MAKYIKVLVKVYPVLSSILEYASEKKSHALVQWNN